MRLPWQDVRCASIPEEDLSVLADLRREPGIRVTVERGRAWVSWEDGPDSDATRRILLERLLPLAGAEIFARLEGRWRRPGHRLPAFDVPIGDGPHGMPLARAILPEPLEIVPPPADDPRPVRLRLVRDDRGIIRPATAVRCRLADLLVWADRAPSGWIESLSGAWSAPQGGNPAEAEVIVLAGGDARARSASQPAGSGLLPPFDCGLRFWGNEVLIPLGYRADPELIDRALREALSAGPDDLVLLDHGGPERIPRQAFRPLCRSSIRLAAAARPPGRATGAAPP